MAERAKAEIGGPDFGRAAKQLATRPTLRTLAIFYWARVRAQPFREFLALVGIAAGVALLFAVQISNKSITGSVEQLAHGIAGKASLEVAARGPEGFSQSLVRKVERLPSVRGAAPVLEQRVAVVGTRGRRPLTLFGVDQRLQAIGGPLVKQVARDSRGLASLGLNLPAPAANAIGAAEGKQVSVEIGERTVPVPVAGIAGAEQVGSLAESPAAVAPLGQVQEIARMHGRITRVLVAPVPGREGQTRAALARLAADRLDVRASDVEARLLGDAAKYERQGTTLVGAISLVVGLLLAYNAMLLTVLERRTIVATLRTLGAARKAIIASLLFDAVVLGLAGSLVGLALGDQLSRHTMRGAHDWLFSAFVAGSQRSITPEIVVLSIVGGTLAAVAAAVRPAVALLKVGPLGAVSKDDPDATKTRSSHAQRWLFWAGAVEIALVMVGSVVVPQTTPACAGLLFVGLVMILPAIIARLLLIAQRVARHVGGAAAHLSTAELVATPARATALAAVGAVAMGAALGVSGPAEDMRQGLKQFTADYYANADLWVTAGGSENIFATVPFDHKRAAKRIERIPYVESVRTARATFQDVGGRRLLVNGESPGAPRAIPPSLLVEGDLALAERRLRRSGWAALSPTLAKQRNLRIGQTFGLPTPSGPQRFRLAATVATYGWPPGTVVMNARDFGRAWDTTQATALQVDLTPGATPGAAKLAIQRALGKASALRVLSADETRAQSLTSSRQAFSRYDQIANMVLVAMVLAVAAAMLAAVWQRRQRLTALRALGMGSAQLYRALLLETGVVLLAGCAIGVVFGFLVQWMNTRYFQLYVGFPTILSPPWELVLETLTLAALLVAAATAIPARLSLRFDPQATFSPE